MCFTKLEKENKATAEITYSSFSGKELNTFHEHSHIPQGAMSEVRGNTIPGKYIRIFDLYTTLYFSCSIYVYMYICCHL